MIKLKIIIEIKLPLKKLVSLASTLLQVLQGAIVILSMIGTYFDEIALQSIKWLCIAILKIITYLI